MDYLLSIHWFGIIFWAFRIFPPIILHGPRCCMYQTNHLLMWMCLHHMLTHLPWSLKAEIMVNAGNQANIIPNAIIATSLATSLTSVFPFMFNHLGQPMLPKLLLTHLPLSSLWHLLIYWHLELCLLTSLSSMRSIGVLVPLLLLHTQPIPLLVSLTPHPLVHGYQILVPPISSLVVSHFSPLYLLLVYLLS